MFVRILMKNMFLDWITDEAEGDDWDIDFVPDT